MSFGRSPFENSIVGEKAAEWNFAECAGRAVFRIGKGREHVFKSHELRGSD